MLPRASVASTKGWQDAGSSGNCHYRGERGRRSAPRDRGRGV